MNPPPTRWIDAKDFTPIEWAATQSFFRNSDMEGRYKVRLIDGREIFTWWQNGQWSVERLKPHLKVAFWVQPVLIA